MAAKKNKASASEMVFDSILNDITNLEYNSGDRLPSTEGCKRRRSNAIICNS